MRACRWRLLYWNELMPLKPFSLQVGEELLLRYPALAPLSSPIVRAVEIICDSHRAGGRLLVCGNGGSAADAEHIVGELVKGFVLRRAIGPKDRERLQQSGCDDWREIAEKLQGGVAAMSLTGPSALTTAIANDVAAEMVFAQQVYVHGRQGDVLLGLSSSGNSKNVLAALKVARAFGLTTLGLTGSQPSRMGGLCDVIIPVPATETFKIQELHLPIYHAICLMIERELFSETPPEL